MGYAGRRNEVNILVDVRRYELDEKRTDEKLTD